ncbi:enoyl-CoA hydratase [Zobellella aerophila]|uniref:Enoyl-CoA hydratase n=1 Tax=Zobellella aerophila TaxID=870480 RepID=A0ABP6V567_9GAMM
MSEIIVEERGEGIVLLRLNRPEHRNALSQSLKQRLAHQFDTLGMRPDVRCIILTGGSEVFAAGADLKEMIDQGAIEMLRNSSHPCWQAIARCPKPVIAAVNGFALGGGCELAMHADIIVAGESARFGQPEVRVGIMPGAGGTQRLTRVLGKYKAMQLLLTGRPIEAADAGRLGLVSEVVPDAEVLPVALKMAAEIAAMPPLAVQQIKEVVLAGQDASLDSALMLERKAFQLLFDSRDQKEGMRAFIEKRHPRYEGR